VIAHILPCILEIELLALAAFALQHARELLALATARVWGRR
jgi:hypothetical protein